MSHPRVFHLIHHLRVGGAETLLKELLPLLAAEGFSVQAVCLDDRGPLFDVLKDRGVPCHFIGRKRGFDPAALWRLAHLLRRERVDILNTHAFSAGLWGRLAAVFARPPRTIVTEHSVAGWSQPAKQRSINRLLRPVTDRFVAVSESVRRSLLAQGVPPGLIEVIHNGIRTDRFRPAVNSSVERMRLGLPAEGPLIGMVGRCSHEKGGDIFIRALAALVRDGHPAHGLVVGDGPARSAWQTEATKAALESRVRFVGEQPDVAPWLAACDAVVLPSRHDAFPTVAMEALAAGLPIVATRVEGIPEIVRDGTDGTLIPPEDPIALATAVRHILNAPNNAIERSRSAKDRFSIERTAKAYADFYRTLGRP